MRFKRLQPRIVQTGALIADLLPQRLCQRLLCGALQNVAQQDVVRVAVDVNRARFDRRIDRDRKRQLLLPRRYRNLMGVSWRGPKNAFGMAPTAGQRYAPKLRQDLGWFATVKNRMAQCVSEPVQYISKAHWQSGLQAAGAVSVISTAA